MHEKPRWGIIDLLLVYAGTIFFTLILSQWGKDLFNARMAAQGLHPSDLQIFLSGFLIQFVVTVSLVLIAVRLRGGSLKSLGLRLARAGSWIRYGLLGGILIAIVILLAGLLIQHLHPQLAPQSFEEVLGKASTPYQFLALLLVGSVLAPFAEELFYRGMVYPVFRWHLGRFPGMLVSGLLFGAAHWDLWRAIPLAIGGAFLCWVYEKSGSILVSALTHGVWNGLMAVLVYYSVVLG
ncbi:MAG TPA: type II CAAX endopeptidase family protein [Syntrophomonadaceae bacterium]|nr:type II CAAX endopeptidase family protein [Syntrophomonadaceae bacterium]